MKLINILFTPYSNFEYGKFFQCEVDNVNYLVSFEQTEDYYFDQYRKISKNYDDPVVGSENDILYNGHQPTFKLNTQHIDPIKIISHVVFYEYSEDGNGYPTYTFNNPFDYKYIKIDIPFFNYKQLFFFDRFNYDGGLMVPPGNMYLDPWEKLDQSKRVTIYKPIGPVYKIPNLSTNETNKIILSFKNKLNIPPPPNLNTKDKSITYNYLNVRKVSVGIPNLISFYSYNLINTNLPDNTLSGNQYIKINVNGYDYGFMFNSNEYGVSNNDGTTTIVHQQNSTLNDSFIFNMGHNQTLDFDYYELSIPDLNFKRTYTRIGNNIYNYYSNPNRVIFEEKDLNGNYNLPNISVNRGYPYIVHINNDFIYPLNGSIPYTNIIVNFFN